MSMVTFRNGTPGDSLALFHLFYQTVSDYMRRRGITDRPTEEDMAEAEKEWHTFHPVYDYLATGAEHFVVAEIDGEPVGYARSILRGAGENTMRELTEYFVLPGQQSAGVGKSLLERVFPVDGATYRVIVATTDAHALARYLKSGVYARFPVYNFSRTPRKLPVDRALRATRLTGDPADLVGLAEIDRAVLGFTRDQDHRYWVGQRAGFFYEMEGRRVGYGYSGYDGGPFALLDSSCFSAVLAHAENEAAKTNDRFHLELPLINSTAVDYLLANGYEMSEFTTFFMSSRPFGRFENYILHSPPFFL